MDEYGYARRSVCRAAWIRYAAVLLVSAAFLLSGVVSAVAAPDPYLEVDAGYDSVGGWGWPANSTVTVTINDPGIAPFDMTTDDFGSFHSYMWELDQENPFDIVPGMTVTSVSGVYMKTHVVFDVVVREADADSDVVTGTSTPNMPVRVEVYAPLPYQPYRETTASPEGEWSVSFADTDTANPNPDDPSGHPFDIQKGMAVGARRFDGDGDSTRSHFVIPNPFMYVDPTPGMEKVWGEGWPGSSWVTIDIDTLPLDGVPDFTMPAYVGGDGWFWRSTNEFGAGFDIQPGDRVTVSSGPFVKSTTVTGIGVTGIDVEADTVSGVAQPGGLINVNIPMTPYWRETTASAEGMWSVSFATTDTANPNLEDEGRNPFDITPGRGGMANECDEDGDRTAIEWRVMNPYVGVSPADDNTWGGDWAPNAQITITCDSLANGSGVDHTMYATSDPYGNYGQGTNGEFDIISPCIVTVSDGVSTKTHSVTGVDITGVDEATEIVTGIAAPGSTVQVWVSSGGESSPTREVTATPGGVWTANFAIEGEGGWGGTWDIAPGTQLTAGQWDEDGDHTVDNWRISAPGFGVNPFDDSVWGMDWTPGGQVTITMDDGNPDVSPDFETTASVEDDGSFGMGTRDDQGEGFDIQPGMLITVTDGAKTKTHTVTEVDITGVDDASDVATGTAIAGSTVQIWVNVEDGDSPTRNVTADGDGMWTADFANEGEGAWGGTWDIGPGTSLTAMQADEDGDHTVDNWRIPYPWIWADPQQETVGVNDFLPNSEVNVTVEDSTTPKSPDATATVQSDGSGWAYFEDLGDINGDCVVSASDGTNARVLDVAPLSITAVDIQGNFISGTADPLASLNLGFFDGYWGPPVIADSDGNWIRDYDDITEVQIQLEPGHEGMVSQPDEDGDQTQVNWRARAPRIEVSAVGDWIEGHDWTPGVSVLVTVDDSLGPDFVTNATPDWGGYIGLWDLQGFDVKPGQTVTLSDGTNTKTHVVTPLTVDGFDIEADTVWGTVEPGTSGWIDIWNEFGTGRHIAPEPDGAWVVDFTEDVGAEGWMLGFNLVQGTEGRASQGDEDGDRTAVDWRIPQPRIQVDPQHDTICGQEFIANSQIFITIEDSTTEQSPDATTAIEADDGGNFCIDLQQGGFGDITSDCFVTVSDGLNTKTLDVTQLTITDVDVEQNSISGTAEPSSVLNLVINDGYWGPEVIADAEGNWVRDYDDITEVEIHLQPGDQGSASQDDVDGDQTRAEWRVPKPRVEVSAVGNWLEGHDWDPGVPVLVTVEDHTTPATPDFVTTAYADSDRYIGLWDTGFDVEADQLVTFTDGSTTVSHTVTPLLITGWDEGEDTVSGTAEPFSYVRVELWDDEGTGRDTQADASGNWIVDYTDQVGPEPWQRAADLVKGTDGRARQSDDEGDQTSVDFHILNPRFTASPIEDVVWGSDWTPSATMTVTIDASGTAAGVDATFVTQSDENGGFGFGAPGPPMGGEVNAGDIITVTDGVTTKTHTVTALAITSFNRFTGFIEGVAEPLSWFNAWYDGIGGGQDQADADGRWTGDLSGGGTPLPPGASGGFEQFDDDSDSTVAFWRVNWAETYTDPKHDTIEGSDWPNGALVHITIEDTTTGTSPDYEATVTADGGFFGTQGLEDMIDIVPGMVVTATDGDYVKTHVVTPLTVTDVQADTDIVAGHAEPFTQVWIRVWPEDWGMEVQRMVTVDGSGHWSVDLTDPDGSPLPEGRGCDLQLGTAGTANQGDEDADFTTVPWSVPKPRFSVNAELDKISGLDFTPTDPVTITVNAVVVGVDYTDVDGAFGESALGVDVEAGDVVTVTDSAGTKSLSIAPLAVGGADAVTDHVWGTTTPSAWVVAVFDDTPAWSYVQADSEGQWDAYFSPGDPSSDILPSTTGTVRQEDADGDETVMPWHVSVLPPGDSTPPVTTPSGVPEGWVSDDVTVTLSADDGAEGSGVESIRYVVGALPPIDVAGATAEVLVTGEGEVPLAFRAIDTSGNAETTQTVTVRIDKTAPPSPSLLSYSSLTTTTVTLSWPAVTDNDDYSGFAFYEVLDNGVPVGTTAATTKTLADLVPGSSHSFAVRSVDNVGNRSADTTLALTMPTGGGSGEIPAGESVTATLAVDVAGHGSPTGEGTVTVTITGVTEGGTLTLVRSDRPPFEAPPTFKFVNDYFDVDFTGSFTGTLTITLPYDPRIPDARAMNLKLKHWVDNEWVEVPTTVDLVNHTITAELTSLSPLAIVEPADAVATATISPKAALVHPSYGKSGTFTLRLAATDASATPLPDFELVFERYSATTGLWTQVATCTPVVGTPGSYQVTVSPVNRIRTVFRARIVPNVLYTAADSTVYLVPHAKLTAPKLSSRYPRRYTTYTVTGRVYPGRSMYAYVRVYRYSSGKYRLYTTKKVRTSSTGYYKAKVRFSRTGAYKFRVYVGAYKTSANLAKTWSSYSSKYTVR